jgi:chromosome segregation ATPase
LTATQRIDCPHEVGVPAAESLAVRQTPPAAAVADAPATEQIHLQADQLAAHLRGRQKELDYREAELNARLAKFESEGRAIRLWLAEREAELAARGEQLTKRDEKLTKLGEELTKFGEELTTRDEELAKRQRNLIAAQQEASKRLTRLAAAEAVQEKRSSGVAIRQEHDSHQVATALAASKIKLDEAEQQLAEAQAETARLSEQLSGQRQMLTEETTAMRQQMATEHQRAMADLEQKRQAVERRADHVDQSFAALKALRAELGRMHRETLEIRLATEELWVQLSGAAPPAALTQSLGRIRSKLAEQYHQANTELGEQKKELEAIRSQLLEQHENVVDQKRRFEQWATGCQEECQRSASRLVAREQQLHHEEAQVSKQSLQWQAERSRYQQEIRRLRTAIAEQEAAALPAY